MKKVFRISLLALVLGAAAFCANGQTGLPQRIVSVSPNVTEILYGLGAFDRVVAVSDYCTYPPAVKNLPRVGGWENSNIEKIAALRPDLVILTDAQQPFLKDKLQQLGMRTLTIPSRFLSDVFVAIEEIGTATGRQAEAKELARSTRTALGAVRNQAKALPSRSVLFVVDRTPGTLRDLYVATEGSYLAEIIGIAGGRSIAESTKSGYSKISKEAILTLNPEVIIDMVQGSKGKFGENPEMVWHDLPELRAVREGHVYPIREEFVPHASQFVADTAQLFLRLIHPEILQGRNPGATP